MAEHLFRVVSMEYWPPDLPQTKKPRSAAFRAAYSSTLLILARELRHLGAKNVVLECDADWTHIRRDGQLRADAQLRSQGVILSFDSSHGPLRYPCDTYDRWQDNLRAIALSLEALRAVNRHGVSKRGEQYRGWDLRLPSAGGATGAAMNPRGAAQIIAVTAYGDSPDAYSFADAVLQQRAVYHTVVRLALKKSHPDTGGTVEQFRAVQSAREILDKYHGLVDPQGVRA